MSQQGHWIPVEATNGGFSSEQAVALQLADGKKISLFADRKLIKNDSNQSYLCVTLVESFPEKKRELVLLPGEAFETASPWAEVSIR